MIIRTLKQSRVCGAILPYLLLAALSGAALFEHRAAHAAQPLTPSERDYLNRKGAVAYCLDPDRPPFSAVRNGQPEGMAVDVVARIEKVLEVPFRFVPTETRRMSLSYLESGECDILPMMELPPPGRRADLRFTTPFFRYAAAIVTQSHAPFISGIRDLHDRTIGIGENDPLNDIIIDRFARIPFTVVGNPRDGLLKVASGNLDAFIVGAPIAIYHIRRFGLTHLKVAGQAGIFQEMGIGVSPKSLGLQSILNKALKTIDEPAIETLYRKHIAVEPKQRIDAVLLIQIVLGIAAAGGILAIWRRKVRRLKKRIAKAEAELAAKDEQMKQMAITDPLTSLNNRIRLIDILTKEMQRFRRYGRPASIVVADVDHFKEINEAFGYNLGDVAICKIGQRLAANVRKADICGRWGGEKFMVICPETGIEGAWTLAENLRKKIASLDLPKAGPRTCSFGIAAFTAGDTEETIVQRASNAQKLAKEKGGNRVEAA